MAFAGDIKAIGDYKSSLTTPIRQVADKLTAGTNRILKKSMDEITPTSVVDDDPMEYRYISYPRDLTQDMANGHYMLFYVNVQNKSGYEYTDQATGVKTGGKVEVKSSHTDTEYGGMGPIHYVQQKGDDIEYQNAFDRIAKGGQGNNLQSDEVFLTPNSRYQNSAYGQMGGISSVYKTTTRITDSVALYLPPNVEDNTAATYRDNQTGIVGLVAAGGGQFLDAMKRNDYQSAASQLIGGVKAISEEALRQSGGAFIDTIAGTEGSADLANLAFGQATNPYMEVMFDSMSVRTFSYNFSFEPRNTQERDDVQDIIKLFRFHMAPELKGAQHRFLTLPSTFDIHYMYQHSKDFASENNFYSKIATCVLEGVNVNYTADGVKSFQDGSPTKITMLLTFKETELLNKQMINAGY